MTQGQEPQGSSWKGTKEFASAVYYNCTGRRLIIFCCFGLQGKEKIPCSKGFIAMLKTCLVPGLCLLNDYINLCQRLLPTFAGHSKVTKNGNKVKERQLKWTAYKNINMWFSKVKHILVTKGFARLKQDDEICEGEIVVFLLVNLTRSSIWMSLA